MVEQRGTHVVIKLNGTQGTFPVDMWLREMSSAIVVRERAMKEKHGPQTDSEWWAWNLLNACLPSLAGETTQEKIDGFVNRLVALRSDPDPSRIVRCAKCQAILTNKVSIAIGLGPECRK